MTKISHRLLRVVLAAAFLFALMGGGCAKEERPAPAPVVKKTIPKEEAKAAEAAHARITSYNVCYTKLLRIRHARPN